MAKPRRRKRRMSDEQERQMRERGERLRQAAQAVGITHAAKAAAVPYTTLRDYMNGGEMKLSSLAALARACGVSLDWIAYGKGDVFEAPAAASEHASRGGHQVVISWFDDRDEGLRVGKSWLETAIPRECTGLRLVPVTGDAMAPTLHDGDLAVIDTAARQIQGGAIYAIAVDDGVLVRRLEKRLGGGIRALADHDRYPPQDLSGDEADSLKILGEVVWVGGPPRS
ncbi:LexA family transcriptional regulator [Acidomonas methanolica]|nr:LexA family transcriptional regulator [Acidomonas methanolica]TCS19058.1 helix-turn-helix protein [Acidomonas methanolica]